MTSSKFINYNFINKILSSPTVTTWGSLSATILGWVILLPVALTRLSTSEIALWYFFRLIFDLRPIIDMGFSPTFIRQFAYAFGGSSNLDLDPALSGIGELVQKPVQWEFVKSIYETMDFINLRLACILALGLATVGTALAFRPISTIENPKAGWWAWAIVILSTTIYLRGNSYSSFLQGSGNIPLYRRWEAIFGLLAIPSGVIILLLGGGLLGLVISEQFWLVISVIRNRILSQQISTFKIKSNFFSGYSKDIMDKIWPLSWRSGMGIAMGYGIIQSSGIFYAQIGNTPQVAAYLLGLRFAQNISAFARVPFYSHLPHFASLYAAGKIADLLKSAKKAMAITNWVYCFGFIGFGILAPWILRFINSNTEFVPQQLWAVLGLALFIERYGAMHLQLYTLTNHVVWHIANGITGIITIGIVVLTLAPFGVFAFPIAYLLANIGFYAWYSARLSYKHFKIRFLDFETFTFLVPVLIFIIYGLVVFFQKA